MSAMTGTPPSSTHVVASTPACINDLISVLALPAMWSGGEPYEIAHTLLDSLLPMLHLDFVYVRLTQRVGEEPIELIRIAHSQTAGPSELGKVFQDWLHESPQKWPRLIPNPAGEGEIAIVPLRLGLHNELGLIVAGSHRPDFPAQTERVVLSVAANQAAIGLQEARLLSEQRRVARELDQRVAQRTAELAAANEELRKEVAERRRAEAALRQSEARLADGERDLQLTIDTIPVFVATYQPDGTRSFVNRTWQEYMGLTLEEATGAGAKTFPHFHPADAERNDQAWRASLVNGEPLSIEVRVRRADGQYRWHTSRRVPLRDEKGDIVRWYSVGIDIEDQKVAEDALRRSEARLAETERELRKIIDTIPALAWSARTDGTTEFFNQHYLDYVGLSPEQAQGWGWAVAVHPDDLNALAGTWQLIMASGQSGETEARLRRHDGEYRWFLFRVNPLRDDAGNVIKWYGTNIDIEDRKRADEALRREVIERTRAEQLARIDETRFRRFFDLPLIGMAVSSPERRFLEVNEKLCQILGYGREELIARDWASITHPDDLSGNLGLLDEAMTGATEGYSMDKRYIHRDGHIVYASISVCCVRRTDGSADHFVLTVQDVTARRQVQEQLRRSETRFRSLTELSSDWYWEQDENMRFTYFSSLFHDLSGYSAQASIGKTRWELEDMTPVSTTWPEHMAVLEARRPFRDLELRRVMQDGAVRYLSISGAPIFDEQGRFKGYEGVGRNITERKRVEEALHQTQAELAHVARVTSLGALTASIAHEINQPLSGIITNAGTCLRMLAADPPNVDGASETARRTLRDGNRASEVITRLRALFSKKDAVTDSVDLNEATREVIALSLSELQRSRVVLRSELADDVPLVTGDRVQLQQVILNLLLNAADAMSGVDDRPRQLVIKSERDEGDRVRLSIRDAGVGFEPQAVDKLFEPFYTTKSGGMGIGLSVSRSIIESHHGRLWAAPNDGPGATFSFSIPRGN